MRILHIVDHSIPLHSGYTFRSLAIFRQQRALGLETFHLTGPKHNLTADNVPARENVEGLLFHRTQPASGSLNRLPLVNQLAIIHQLKRRLREVIDEVRPDILHAHSPALNGLPSVLLGGSLGIPVVYEIRGFWEDAAVSHGTHREGSARYRLARAMETWTARRADALTCICQGIKGDLIERGIPEGRIGIIPNAVDAERFSPLAQRDTQLEQQFGLSGKEVVGFIGSFYAYEGLTLLLDALPRVLAQRPNIRLLLVGGGQEKAALLAQTKALGIADKVLFPGRVAHDQVARYYSLIDLLCYPRLPMRVTELITPLKPLEAMAMHKPLVASDVGGHRELIRDGQTGTLFKAGDTRDLSNKILELLAERRRWPSLLSSARSFVEQERTWEKSIAGYLPIYESLLTNR